MSTSTLFSIIWPIDRTLSGATTPGQSGPGSDGNKELLSIPHCSSITGTSPSDCSVSYPSYSLRGESYPFSEIQLVYSTARADWPIYLLNTTRMCMCVYMCLVDWFVGFTACQPLLDCLMTKSFFFINYKHL